MLKSLGFMSVNMDPVFVTSLFMRHWCCKKAFCRLFCSGEQMSLPRRLLLSFFLSVQLSSHRLRHVSLADEGPVVLYCCQTHFFKLDMGGRFSFRALG